VRVFHYDFTKVVHPIIEVDGVHVSVVIIKLAKGFEDGIIGIVWKLARHSPADQNCARPANSVRSNLLIFQNGLNPIKSKFGNHVLASRSLRAWLVVLPTLNCVPTLMIYSQPGSSRRTPKIFKFGWNSLRASATLASYLRNMRTSRAAKPTKCVSRYLLA
jgi:hypothetical protein